jgi:hypothetical protein
MHWMLSNFECSSVPVAVALLTYRNLATARSLLSTKWTLSNRSWAVRCFNRGSRDANGVDSGFRCIQEDLEALDDQAIMTRSVDSDVAQIEKEMELARKKVAAIQ